MNIIKKIVKLGVPIVILIYLGYIAWQDWPQASIYLAHANYWWLVGSLVIMIAVFPQAGYVWHTILRALHIETTYQKSFSVWMISLTSRYLPGSVWMYFGRIQLAKSKLDVSRKLTLQSIGLEVMYSILAASVWSIPTLIVFHLWGIVALIVSVVCIVFFLLTPRFVLMWSKLVPKYLIAKFGEIPHFTLQKSSVILFTAGVNFAINGIALMFLTRALYSADIFTLSNYIIWPSLYALSWLTGYISFFAPAGIGPTELVMTSLLSLYLPPGLAAIIALTYRVLLIGVEGIVFSYIFVKNRHE